MTEVPSDSDLYRQAHANQADDPRDGIGAAEEVDNTMAWAAADAAIDTADSGQWRILTLTDAERVRLMEELDLR